MSNRRRHRKRKSTIARMIKYDFYVKAFDDISKCYLKYYINNGTLKTCQIEEDTKK